MGTTVTSKPVIVYYAAGPGDVGGTYRHYKEGRDDPGQMSVTYSGQVFEACARNGWRLVVDCDRPAAPPIIDDKVEIHCWPIPLKNKSGLLYNLGQVIAGLRMTWRAWRAGASVALLTDGCHWFSFALMPVLGIRIVPSLHCKLKRSAADGSPLLSTAINTLNGWFWRWCVSATVCSSHDQQRQLESISPKQSAPVIIGLPHYREATFQNIGPPPPWNRDPFVIMYAGRITEGKGVVHLVDIAGELKQRCTRPVLFHICGDGVAMNLVKEKVLAEGLEERFILHGHLSREAMREIASQSHAAIVCTTRRLGEGFCMAAVEPVLAGRPVVCADIAPALEYIGEAATVVEADHWEGFTLAVLELAENETLWEKRCNAANTHREQFLSPQHSYGAAVEQAVKQVINL